MNKPSPPSHRLLRWQCACWIADGTPVAISMTAESLGNRERVACAVTSQFLVALLQRSRSTYRARNRPR